MDFNLFCDSSVWRRKKAQYFFSVAVTFYDTRTEQQRRREMAFTFFSIVSPNVSLFVFQFLFNSHFYFVFFSRFLRRNCFHFVKKIRMIISTLTAPQFQRHKLCGGHCRCDDQKKRHGPFAFRPKWSKRKSHSIWNCRPEPVFFSFFPGAHVK